MDIALDCAAQHDAAPATLIRAARDLKFEEPDFAAQVAVCAVRHLVHGLGYEPSPLDIDEAVEHLMVAAERIGASDWALQELRRISSSPRSGGLMADRLARVLSSIDESRKKAMRAVLSAPLVPASRAS